MLKEVDAERFQAMLKISEEIIPDIEKILKTGQISPNLMQKIGEGENDVLVVEI